jgi:hypothetical protein
MSAKIFILPLLNSLKSINQTDGLNSNNSAIVLNSLDPSFNYRGIDDDFYFKNLKYFEYKTPFAQQFQQSDTIFLQWLSEYSDLSRFQYARFLDDRGNVFTPKMVTVVKETGTYSSEIDGELLTSLSLYSVTIKLYDMAEGNYFLQCRYYEGVNYYNVIHEPISVKQIHENTVRIDYYNSYNDQSVIYPTSAYIPQIRVDGFVKILPPEAEFETYTDQPLDKELVSGIASRTYELFLNNIPDYLADKINRIMLCDIVTIDGFKYTREQGAKLEQISGDDKSALSNYKLKLGERINTSTVNVGYSTLVLGDMPQTNYFWIERIRLSSYYNIRLGFKGKRNFLDYLNATFLTANGYFAEDANNKLIFVPYSNYLPTGTWALDDVDVIKYGIRIEVAPSGGTVILSFSKGSIGSTVYYAIMPGNGSSNVNKTAYTGAVNPSYTFTKGGEYFIYFSDCETLYNFYSSATMLSIGGDLPPSMNGLYFNYAASKLARMDNNMFNYVTSLANLYLVGNINTFEINNIIRILYDSIPRLNASCNVYLNGQTPSAPPSNELLTLKAIVKSYITTLSTD